MPVEVLSFDLSQRGTPVGSHVLRTELRGSTGHMEGRLQLSGPLGRCVVTQTSRSHVRQHHSLSFREEQQKRGDNRTFEVRFDRGSGLVHAVRSGSDRAEEPLTKAFRDPLGMLFEIRQQDPDSTAFTIPMLGKDVQVTLIQSTALETAVGPRPARVYRLFPGGSLLWIGEDDANVILKMQQKIAGSPVDVVLTRIASEQGKTREAGSGRAAAAPAGQSRDGRKSRSRRGRRRRRRQE